MDFQLSFSHFCWTQNRTTLCSARDQEQCTLSRLMNLVPFHFLQIRACSESSIGFYSGFVVGTWLWKRFSRDCLYHAWSSKHRFLRILWEVWETNSLVLNFTFSYIFVHDSEHLETIGTKTFVISSWKSYFKRN